MAGMIRPRRRASRRAACVWWRRERRRGRATSAVDSSGESGGEAALGVAGVGLWRRKKGERGVALGNESRVSCYLLVGLEISAMS